MKYAAFSLVDLNSFVVWAWINSAEIRAASVLGKHICVSSAGDRQATQSSESFFRRLSRLRL